MIERNLKSIFLDGRPMAIECQSLIDDYATESGWSRQSGRLRKGRWRLSMNRRTVAVWIPGHVKKTRPLIEVARAIATRFAKEREQLQ